MTAYLEVSTIQDSGTDFQVTMHRFGKFGASSDEVYVCFFPFPAQLRQAVAVAASMLVHAEFCVCICVVLKYALHAHPPPPLPSV